MAGRMIRVISAHVTRDVERTYGMRGDNVRQFTFWKRQIRKREEPKYEHDENNFWTQQHCFFIFFMLLGNGVDAMPHTMRFALRVSGGLFLIYELLFSMLLTLPLLHTEMFLGRYSGLTNSQMFRMTPISFGICVLTLIQDLLYSSMSSPSIAMALMGALEHLLKTTWQCPPDEPICYDYYVEGPIGNCTREHLLLNCNGRTRLIVSTFYFWKGFRDVNDFAANWQLIIVTTITWIFIMIIVNFRMRILELLLKIFFILSIFMHLVLFLLAVTSTGAHRALRNMYDFKITTITPYTLILSGFLMPVKHNVIYGGGYMTYAASIRYKSKFGLTTNTILLLLANYSLNIYYLLVFHAIVGVIGNRTGIDYQEAFIPFVGMYYAMVSEFLRSMNCPHIFISIYHLSNWLLECTKLTIIIRMHINNLYDFFPSIVVFRAHTRIAWVGICTFIGLVDTLGICVKLLNEMMWMANLYMMNGFQIFMRSLLLFYGYGVSRLNDDIHFYSGQRPVQFWRIIWKIYPFLMLSLLLVLSINGWNDPRQTDFIAEDFQADAITADSFIYTCIAMSSLIFLGMFIISFLYVVLQMRASMRITLTTPLFHWGPPCKEDRVQRKAFTPRVAIRSQRPKKYRQRFREHSVRQQHEREFAEHVKRGRLFLDKEFFVNLSKEQKKIIIEHVKKKSKYSIYSYEQEQVKRKKKKKTLD